jgi:hypothetical protein
MGRGKGKGPIGIPLEGDNVMSTERVSQLIDTILEYDEGEPNELQNEPDQNPEDELEKIDADLGGDEGEELEDYEMGEEPEGEPEPEDVEEMANQMVDTILLDQDNAHQAYFRTVMKKHNIKGIRGLSSEKRSAFFKDVSAGWRKHKKVGEALEADAAVGYQVKEQYEDYKQYFNYLAEQCGIDDMSALKEEDLAQFYGLVFEAYEVGMLYEGYKDLFKSLLDKEGKGIKDMSSDEKKSFFNKVDVAWKSKEE